MIDYPCPLARNLLAANEYAKLNLTLTVQLRGIDTTKLKSLITKLLVPIAKIFTIPVILAIQNWHLHPLDVNVAFLHSNLDEGIRT